MMTTVGYARVPITTRRAGVLKVVRATDTAGCGERTLQHPIWWVPYGTALLTGGSVFAVEVLLPESLLRTLAELLATLGGVALVRLWIGCNRSRLARDAKRDDSAVLGPSKEVSSIHEGRR